MNTDPVKQFLYAVLSIRVFQYEVYFDDIQTLETTREVTGSNQVVMALYRQMMAGRGWQTYLNGPHNGRYELLCSMRTKRFSECSR